MRGSLKFLVIPLLVMSLAVLSGCGVSKSKYDALLSEKSELEEKVLALTKAKEALTTEYGNLLKEKMELAAKVSTLASEKAALKGEYDKILDEKVALKAAYDKLQADTRARESAKR